MGKYIPVIITFALLTAFTFAGFTLTLANYRNSIQLQFDEEAFSRIAAIENALQDKILILESMLGLFRVYGGVPEFQFGSLVQPFEDKIPGVQALQWIVPVPAGERDAFEAAMVAEGIPGFQITERVDGQMVRAGDRPVYYPIYPVMPLDVGEPTIGFDLGSDPVRNAALQRAINTGTFATSEPVTLLQAENDLASGFLVFAPLFAQDLPTVSNEQQGGLLGLVIGVFRFRDIVENAVAAIEFAPIDLLMEDVSASDPARGTLYRHQFPATGNLSTRGGFAPAAVARIFDFAGRQWSITASPAPAYMERQPVTIAWLVLAAGLLTSFMLAAYQLLYARHEFRLRQAEQARQNLENLLVRSQKMEAMGHLVGGIAHDFNNILTTVQGYCELAQMKNTETGDTEMEDYLKNIAAGSERGERLIQKMLTFSRDIPAQETWVDVGESVTNTLELIKPLISSQISVVLDVADEQLPKVKLDNTSFEQILVNLCINARDAIRNSGEIKITLGKKFMTGDIQCSACRQVFQGKYVWVKVSDNGDGISPEILDSIFVPFFTTKDVGKGSGMGLAIINTIIHNNDGHIVVTSTPGKGTVFELYLPIQKP